MCFCAAQNEMFTISPHRRATIDCVASWLANIVGTHAGMEHRIPAPDRLFPKRFAPGKHSVLQHLFVAAPDVIDENVDGAAILGTCSNAATTC